MRYILLSLALILSVVALGLAHTVVLQPDGAASKDASINQYDPDVNYGNDEYLWMGWDLGWLDSLIKFNGLDSYMGVTVVSATLSLYAYQEWGTLPTGNWVARIDGDWAENTVTYNNNPGWNGDMYLYFDTVPINDWFNLDVSSMVASWLDGSFPHNGFFVAQNLQQDGGRWFYSGEYTTDPNLRPKLTLEYYGVDVQPTSLGTVKAMFK